MGKSRLRTIWQLIRRHLDRSAAQANVILQRFGRELTERLDEAFILERLLACVGEFATPQYAVVLTPIGENEFGVVQTWGKTEGVAWEQVRFGRQDRVIMRLQRGEMLMSWRENEWRDELNLDERARLSALGVVVLVPLRTRDELFGVLALAPQVGGRRYDDDTLALLRTVADQAALAAANARLYAEQVAQSRYLIEQTRRLTDILSLGEQLKSLDRDRVVQSTVEAVRESLGFDLVTLSLIDEQDPLRVRVVAWSGTQAATWQRLAQTTFPLIDFDRLEGVQRLGGCYFAFAPDSPPRISSERAPLPWVEGDQLYVPLTSSEGLIGYLTADRPRNGLRPTERDLEMLEILGNQAAVAIQNAILYDNLDRALDERLAELSTLQEIDRQINARLDFQHVIETTLDWAIQITSATAGSLALVTEGYQFLQIVAHRGYPPELDPYWKDLWPISDGIIGRAVRTGRHQYIEDVTRNADYADLVGGVRSQLVMPIRRQTRVLGVISLESNRPSAFTADHIAFLRRLADHATIAIENAQLYDQARQRVAELTALQQISLDLISSLDLEAVLGSVVRNAQSLFQADLVSLYLYDASQDTIAFAAGWGPQGRLVEPPNYPEADKLSEMVARSGEAIIVPDMLADSSFAQSRPSFGAMACLPLRVDRVLGVFNVLFGRRHLFNSDELLVIQLLVNQAAFAIKNAQLYADVRQANEAKSEFVSIVAHELKVPMTSIRGYARLMEMGTGGELTAQQREFVEVILNNVERMTNLVSDLLDSARIQSGHIRLAPRPMDLSKIVEEAVSSVQGEIAARKHELTVDLPADLPQVRIDPGWIGQVLVNLLSNACKYTPDGGKIRVWAQRWNGKEASDGRWVMCAVSDTGIGLREQDRERLFQQFFRVRDPRMQKESGTGLGLSIARSIVELHGGRIWVESTYGEGSTFYFTLPQA